MLCIADRRSAHAAPILLLSLLSAASGGGDCRTAATTGGPVSLRLGRVHHILKLSVLLMAQLLEVILFLIFLFAVVDILVVFFDIIVIGCEGHFVISKFFPLSLLVFI